MGGAKKGIEVTPQEITAAIAEDCKGMNVSVDDYLKRIIKERYGKTESEWRTEVMKPRLMLAALVRPQIVVDEEDIKKMYENHYGMKAKCKIIMWPKDQRNIAERTYGQLRGPVNIVDPVESAKAAEVA